MGLLARPHPIGVPLLKTKKSGGIFDFDGDDVYYNGDLLGSKSFVRIVSNNYETYHNAMIEHGRKPEFTPGRIMILDGHEYIITRIKTRNIFFKSCDTDEENCSTYKLLHPKIGSTLIFKE